MNLDQQRVALVTGSSRGLGVAIARRLARDGLAVAVNGRGGDAQADEVARGIRAEGGTAGAFAADVTDEREVAGLVAAVSASLGAVEVLVLNATGPQPEAPLADVAWEDHLAQLGFFVKSPVLLGRAVLPGMRARRSGRIIQIDSEVADRPPPGRSAYATAKSAQIGLTRSWARELAPFGITVNTVAPGFVPVERHAGVTAQIRNAYRASVPAGRMGTPDDIAPCRQLPRLTGRRLHHRPAHRRRRRARSGLIATAAPMAVCRRSSSRPYQPLLRAAQPAMPGPQPRQISRIRHL
jgi:3-oxoacyl-[acyl-carrier protein] reductase